MSGYSGRGLSFNTNSRQIEENDCDCEVDGSFIIIPKHNKSETHIVGSPSPSNGMSILGIGEDASVNVHQLGQQAECSASITKETPSETPSLVSIRDPGGDGVKSAVTIPSFDNAHSQRNEDRHSMPWSQVNASVNSNVSSVGSEASSLEEANMMLNHLTIENQKLKVLLADRNEHMKKSLDTYKNLQLSMSLIHEDHKTKYEGSRILIDQLREENLKLKDELSLKQAQLMESSAALTASSTTEAEELGKIQILEKDLHSRQKDLERLNRQLDEQLELISEANLNREKLNELLRRKEVELIGAKSTEANINAYRDLQKERDTLHSAFEDSKVAIEELNKNRLKKDEDIKELSQILKSTTSQLQKSKEQFELQVEETNKLKVIYNQQLEDMTELGSQLGLANSQVKELQERLTTRDNDIISLTTLIEKERHSFAHANEALTENNRENSILPTQMALLKAQEEQTELYKTQMEEYRTNFEEERRDRVSMKERKDELAEELTRLKLELENKTAELDALHRTHLQLSQEHVDRNGELSTPRSSAPSEESGGTPVRENGGSTENEISPCPLCQKNFTTRNALVSHASHCGDVRGPFLFP